MDLRVACAKLAPLFLLAAVSAQAGIVSLLPEGVEHLRWLIRDDAAADKVYQTQVKRPAERALAEEPNPVEELITAGRLKGDPDKVRTERAAADFGKIRALALAFAVEGDGRYLDRSRKFILAWAGKNHATGRPIDETLLEPIIEGYDLLRGSFTADERGTVDAWLSSVARAEIKERDPRKGTAVNNWQSHRLKIIGLIGWTIGDEELQRHASDGFKEQIAANINADGSSFDYHNRDAVSYHAYDLVALLRLAIVLSRVGVGKSPYDHQSPAGASLRKAVAFLIPFATGEKTHAEFVGSTIPFDRARSKNVEEGHVVGAPFDPKRAIPALEEAQYFEPELMRLLSPSLRTVINEATRHSAAGFFGSRYKERDKAASVPITRRYREGEVLHYAIRGTHAVNGKINARYSARATAVVRKSSDGVFGEEFSWETIEKGGKETRLPKDGPRQMLSLDPKFKSALPDLSKFDYGLYGPITDLMTFYVDAQLAIRRGEGYVAYGKESSWAGGGKVVTGYDCIDFDVKLSSALAIRVDHVPPPGGCARVPAKWMSWPGALVGNNWFQVEKEGADFVAGAGRETFAAEIHLDSESGAIESAMLDNPVSLEQRICKDAALTDCGAPEKIEILRKIVLTRDRR